MAAIEKITGAQLLVDEKDAAVLADGGSSDYALGGNGSTFEPVKADRLLHDGDTIKIRRYAVGDVASSGSHKRFL